MSHMNVKHPSRSIQWPFLRLKSYLTWVDTQKNGNLSKPLAGVFLWTAWWRGLFTYKLSLNSTFSAHRLRIRRHLCVSNFFVWHVMQCTIETLISWTWAFKSFREDEIFQLHSEISPNGISEIFQTFLWVVNTDALNLLWWGWNVAEQQWYKRKRKNNCMVVHEKKKKKGWPLIKVYYTCIKWDKSVNTDWAAQSQSKGLNPQFLWTSTVTSLRSKRQ